MRKSAISNFRTATLCGACLVACLPVKAQPDTAARLTLPQVPLATPLIPLEELRALVGGPTTITLHGQNLPLEQVLQAFLTTAGFPQEKVTVAGLPRSPRTLTVDWNQAPFWQAAAEVEKRTGLRWNISKSGLELVPPSSSTSDLNGVVVVENPFLKIIANRVTRSTSAFADVGVVTPEPPNSNFALVLTVYPDPRLQTGAGSIRTLQISRVEGEEAENISVNSAFYLRKDPAYLFTRLTLKLPSALRPGSRLTSIKSVARMALTVAWEDWKVPDLTNAIGSSKKLGQNEYRVDGAEFQGNQLKLSLVSLPLKRPASRLSPATLYSGLRVKDGQGRELRCTVRNNDYSMEPDGLEKLRSEIIVTATPAGGVLQGPFSLEWDIPSQTRTLDTPFEIKDIVVP